MYSYLMHFICMYLNTCYKYIISLLLTYQNFFYPHWVKISNNFYIFHVEPVEELHQSILLLFLCPIQGICFIQNYSLITPKCDIYRTRCVDGSRGWVLRSEGEHGRVYWAVPRWGMGVSYRRESKSIQCQRSRGLGRGRVDVQQLFRQTT